MQYSGLVASPGRLLFFAHLFFFLYNKGKRDRLKQKTRQRCLQRIEQVTPRKTYAKNRKRGEK